MSRTDVNKIDRVIANSIEIYQKELDLKRNGNNYKGLCPFHSEKTPSFNVMSNGVFKCFGCSETGNIITFIRKRYNLSYNEALEYCMKNNALSLVSPVNVSKVIHKEMQVDWIDKPFDDKAKKYWDKYQLPEEFLRQNNVFQAKKIAFNGKVKKYPEESTVFIYWAEELDKIKILQIGENVSKEDKWRNFGIPNHYLWYYNDFVKNPCDKLFLVKSVKDALVLKKLGRCAIAVQNEDAKIQITNNINKINILAKEIYVCYGSDEQGKAESLKLTKYTGWKWFNTKNYLLKYGINDPAEYVKEFGYQMLEKELIKKNL